MSDSRSVQDGWVVFLNGSYGVGKSATLDRVGDVLAERGAAFALMDVDWFHRSWPPAADDPANVLTEAHNLAAVWQNYLRTGPRQPVLAGVLTSERDRRRYEDAFGLPVRSVRLEAEPKVAELRLRRRYTADQDRALSWHLERHRSLARQIAAADLDELVVDTTSIDARGVAEVIVRDLCPAPASGVLRHE